MQTSMNSLSVERISLPLLFDIILADESVFLNFASNEYNHLVMTEHSDLGLYICCAVITGKAAEESC